MILGIERKDLNAFNALILLLCVLMGGFLFMETFVHRAIFYSFLLVSLFCVPFQCVVKDLWPKYKWLLIAVGLYLIYNLLSVFWLEAIDSAAIFTAFKIPVFIVFFVLTLVHMLQKSEKLYSYMLNTYVAFACLVAAVLFFDDFISGQFQLQHLGYEYRFEGIGRAENSNIFGLLLSISALMILFGTDCFQKLSGNIHFDKGLVLKIAAFLFMFLAVILTGGRGAILALICSMIITGILMGNRRFVFFALLSIVFAMAAVVLTSDILTNFIERASTHRFGIWSLAWDVFLQKPVFGHGIEYNFAFLIPDGRVANTPHNVLLGTLVYGGFAGLLLFFFAAFMMLFHFLKSAKATGNYLPLALLIYGAVAFQFVGHTFFVNLNPEWLFSWIPLAFVMARKNLKYRTLG